MTDLRELLQEADHYRNQAERHEHLADVHRYRAQLRRVGIPAIGTSPVDAAGAPVVGYTMGGIQERVSNMSDVKHNEVLAKAKQLGITINDRGKGQLVATDHESSNRQFEGSDPEALLEEVLDARKSRKPKGAGHHTRA